ncbi:MAG: 3-hydroxy-3-methylglutaryl-CoA reductase, partial [Pyrobaculum sp.]
MEIKLHEFDKIYKDANKAAEARRQYLEKATGVKLENIGKTIIDLNTVTGRNIENVIGAVQIPVGIAGPLLIRGDYADGYYYIPLATTEGALVASVNRGAKILTESGGVRAKVLKDGMARAPLFRVSSVVEAVELAEWTTQHFDELKKVAESTTRFGKLKEIQPFIVGNYVWLRLVFSTGDAMGMNMVTIASDAVARYIQERFLKAKLVALSGNMCVDKKASSVNYLLGRGKSVVAEAVVKKEVL